MGIRRFDWSLCSWGRRCYVRRGAAGKRPWVRRNGMGDVAPTEKVCSFYYRQKNWLLFKLRCLLLLTKKNRRGNTSRIYPVSERKRSRLAPLPLSKHSLHWPAANEPCLFWRVDPERTVVVTTVDENQIVAPEELPSDRVMDSHDLPVDIIVTPSRIINVREKLPKPKVGILWEKISPHRLLQMPILREFKELNSW